MLNNDLTLFQARGTKTATITIRLTHEQKNSIQFLAQGTNVSAFLLRLIAKEHQRQVSNQIFEHMLSSDPDDFFDDLPF